ncbi:MAG TPA: ketol-acid reductoisomerase, partial [Syntrophobacteraceae bacterium]|nr:ketol-acid reductoisomerase [Syntrophobacteraceae bacterium]
MRIFYEVDADLKVLSNKKVGVIGYGSQGHAQAQNLRDSGVDVIVAEPSWTRNYKIAIEDGFQPVSAREAAEAADVIQILTEDHIQAQVYRQELAPFMKQGKTLLFSHGFNIHYGQIVPPPEIDVIMIAPKGPGHLVRSEYVRGAGVPSLVAIQQDASGQALPTALAYAKGIGAT